MLSICIYFFSIPQIVSADLTSSEYNQQKSKIINYIGIANNRNISSPECIIAVIDTGVDTEHEMLQKYIVEGFNLFDNTDAPRDINGHGTQVAGVIALLNEAYQTNIKIMPIKAVGDNGLGQEREIIEGIHYAVKNGAKVIVTSLGINNASKLLFDTIMYAEDSGVLVVAPTGNQNGSVQYPAAFPTVLAVGAVNSTMEKASYSNYGQEIDVVAIGTVVTTSIQNSFLLASGTSIAVPQVAWLAARIWDQDPNLKPPHVREIIRHKAVDVNHIGWNKETGYGIINIDAVFSNFIDFYESNNSVEEAKIIPVGKTITSVLEGYGDKDYYYIDSDYDGYLFIEVDESYFVNCFDALGNKSNLISIKKGKNVFSFESYNDESPVTYTFKTAYKLKEDEYELNNGLSYTMQGGKGRFLGNFHNEDDIDRFQIKVREKSFMKIRSIINNSRLDLAMRILGDGEEILFADSGGNGEEENGVFIAEPGDYTIELRHVNQGGYEIGEYIFEYYLDSII